MRVTLQSQDLVDALKNSAVARSTTLPALTHVLLRTEGKELVVEATDLVTRTVISIPAEILEPGEALLPAERLAAAADGSSPVTVDDAGRLTSGRSRFNLMSMQPEDFPREDAQDFRPLQIDPAALCAAIRESSYAPNDSAPQVACRAIALQTGYVFATNGYVAVRLAINYEGPCVLLPVTQIPRLKGLLNESAQVSVANVRGNRAGLFRVQSGAHMATVVCVDTPPIDFGRHFSGVDFGGPSIAIKRKELLTAVRRFAPFVTVYAKGDTGVVLARDGERLAITNGADATNSDDVTDLVQQAKGGEFRVGLSHRYLIGLLDAIADDVVEFYPHQTKPALFMPIGGDVDAVAHLIAPQAIK